MKRFHQLTEDQQQDAIVFAEKRLIEAIDSRLITTDKPINKSHLKHYATAAAEEAWYSEPTDMIVADIAG